MSEVFVEIVRGGLVESIHRGDLAVVDAAGRLVAFAGDPEKVTYMRSSAKPIQAVPLVESGAADRFALAPAELAVTCASHNAEAEHVETVAGLLARIGLDASALRCGAHAPYHAPSAAELVRRGLEPTPLHSNCSGKHTGMLATCVHLGYPTDAYIAADHPLQRRIRQVLAEVADYPSERIHVGVDGCSVPVFALPVRNMALAFARLAAAPQEVDETPAPQATTSGAAPAPFPHAPALGRIVGAMTSHPQMVAGTGRFDTDLMRATGGRLVSKGGAEAVQCIGNRALGLGLALKIEDGGGGSAAGSGRSSHVAAMAALEQLGWLGDAESTALAPYRRKLLKNVAGREVGEARATFTLR